MILISLREDEKMKFYIKLILFSRICCTNKKNNSVSK